MPVYLTGGRNANASGPPPPLSGDSPTHLSRRRVCELLAELTGETASDIEAFALFIGKSNGETLVVHSPNADPTSLVFNYLSSEGN